MDDLIDLQASHHIQREHCLARTFKQLVIIRTRKAIRLAMAHRTHIPKTCCHWKLHKRSILPTSMYQPRSTHRGTTVFPRSAQARSLFLLHQETSTKPALKEDPLATAPEAIPIIHVRLLALEKNRRSTPTSAKRHVWWNPRGTHHLLASK